MSKKPDAYISREFPRPAKTAAIKADPMKKPKKSTKVYVNYKTEATKDVSSLPSTGLQDRDQIKNRSPKKAEVLALNIVRYIAASGLRPGEKLDHETELLVRYQTSRATLREALRILESQGLISVRPGRSGGPVVCAPSAHNLARTLMLHLHLTGATYDQLLEARAITEPLLAKLAARNSDRKKVKAALQPFLTDKPKKSLDRHFDRSFDFHQVIANLAGNPVAALTLSAIVEITALHILNYTNKRVLSDDVLHDHAEIAKAIIARDEVKAYELMEEHSRRVGDRFRALWPRQIAEEIEWR